MNVVVTEGLHNNHNMPSQQRNSGQLSITSSRSVWLSASHWRGIFCNYASNLQLIQSNAVDTLCAFIKLGSLQVSSWVLYKCQGYPCSNLQFR